MKKRRLVSGILGLTLLSNIFIGDASASRLENNIEKNSILQESKPFLPVEMVNQNLKEKGADFRVIAEDMPTLREVNEALDGVVVTKDDPVKEIDLGNGHAITIRVSGTSEPVETRSSINSLGEVSPMAIQAVTAKGSISYKIAGMDTFQMAISVKYNYNDATTKITKYDDPATNYSSGFTWKGKDTTSPYIYKHDDTAMDAVGNGKFSNLIYGSYGCHIEVRFTATGNYYVHDSYFN